MPSFVTSGQAAEILKIPIWKVRIIADSLGVELPRAGRYRLIPKDLLPAIAAKIAK